MNKIEKIKNKALVRSDLLILFNAKNVIQKQTDVPAIFSN